MDLINATGMQAGYTLGVEPSGGEHLVVAVKGTFSIPAAGREPQPAEAQLPLVEADTFTGEPGLSAPVYESDYPLRKPRCDVLLLGSAYAPEGRPTERVQVGFKLGPISKTFRVVGDRLWQVGIGIRPGSYIRPFERMPISYDRAFGGIDNFHPDSSRHAAYLPNPIGRGYHAELKRGLVDGTPMPNTEAIKTPVKKPDGNYRPMAFGPLGRGWPPRLQLAGTYDQDWLDKVFPFLPADFRDDYYQAAPADQQLPYPTGGEEVFLLNLTPEGRASFRLPRIDMPIVFFPKQGERTETKGVIDTIVLEPNQGRFTLTWRASIPLRKNLFEIVQVLAGHMPRGWWRARALGKDYYRTLGELVRERRRQAQAEEVEA
ncbi:DUF2169 family type VI secretion system accessory protein [Candidatus Thiosymbion oneisti]|uniref:DUF2169 family type VI secretion system accessory protein n=1 Tax=Candidatus Thiosymbion oneisti TaxID=589554 RepID=UPI000A7FC322|nr:DUF2169 domain-containing protein [Candidatus Thiosymbion oneisti]